MVLALVSAMRAASETDSEPELRHMNASNGQPPRVWPISARSARSSIIWEMLGVMMLAMAWGFAMAWITGAGAWPKPSMP